MNRRTERLPTGTGTGGGSDTGAGRASVRPRSRRRPVLLVWLVAVVLLGAALQLVRGGSGLVDAAGGVLYALAWALLVALLVPRARAVTCAAVAAGVGVVLELLQLTGLPARWSGQLPPLRLLLGTTFTPWDLLTCLLGAALGGLLLARRTPR
ncbi:DUF2809 domain-containing protein [Auraticoccus monumenti]|uniref:DUF2809 domain-containing protein n=1 Tax=Auraticoccus monumenti TaxID=675864 RepID=A0A1G6RQX4_9ACTN|nr:DUF2809 domain-containing protein [Auraticoccus monumenti]SDD07029.1 Protein of unknown function [Auraticoccus monumenti]